jgi:hypothetical protein
MSDFAEEDRGFIIGLVIDESLIGFVVVCYSSFFMVHVPTTGICKICKFSSKVE